MPVMAHALRFWSLRRLMPRRRGDSHEAINFADHLLSCVQPTVLAPPRLDNWFSQSAIADERGVDQTGDLRGYG